MDSMADTPAHDHGDTAPCDLDLVHDLAGAVYDRLLDDGGGRTTLPAVVDALHDGYPCSHPTPWCPQCRDVVRAGLVIDERRTRAAWHLDRLLPLVPPGWLRTPPPGDELADALWELPGDARVRPRNATRADLDARLDLIRQSWESRPDWPTHNDDD